MATVANTQRRPGGARPRRPRKQQQQPQPTKPPPPLPFGRSLIDHLPEEVARRIFADKHALEFRPTLENIRKFRCVMSSDALWHAWLPIRELLRPLSRRRKLFNIDVEEYEGDVFFTEDVQKVRDAERAMNVKVELKRPSEDDDDYSDDDDIFYYGTSSSRSIPRRRSHRRYTVARIRWLSQEPFRVLDAICVSKALELNSHSQRYILEQVRVDRDDVSFEFV